MCIYEEEARLLISDGRIFNHSRLNRDIELSFLTLIVKSMRYFMSNNYTNTWNLTDFHYCTSSIFGFCSSGLWVAARRTAVLWNHHYGGCIDPSSHIIKLLGCVVEYRQNSLSWESDCCRTAAAEFRQETLETEYQSFPCVRWNFKGTLYFPARQEQKWTKLTDLIFCPAVKSVDHSRCCWPAKQQTHDYLAENRETVVKQALYEHDKMYNLHENSQ